jgi:tetratricopeptide (TPR) repeat protein
LNGISHKGFHYGLAYSTHASINKDDNSPPSNLSFHFGGKVYSAESMQINMGINDILYSSNAEHNLSLYVSLLNSGITLGEKKRLKLQTALGFGTGKINADSHNYLEDISHEARFFFGINMETPYLKDRGGLNVLVDFDGSGTHVGALFNISEQLELKTAITNFQNLGDINKYKSEETETIFSDSPGLSFSLGFKIKDIPQKTPTIATSEINFTPNPDECILIHNRENLLNPIEVDGECDEIALNQFVININKDFRMLNDSILFMDQNLQSNKIIQSKHRYEIKILEDSLSAQYFNQRISISELNIAMKHMTQSLQYYYEEEYILALNQVEEAIKRFPDLAIAYARKGSIYYQMGNISLAILNWNIALKHDPEFTEVQEMLISIDKEIDNIRR